jgi:hypothetical protein
MERNFEEARSKPRSKRKSFVLGAQAVPNGSYGLGIIWGLLVSGAILKNQNKNRNPGK